MNNLQQSLSGLYEISKKLNQKISGNISDVTNDILFLSGSIDYVSGIVDTKAVEETVNQQFEDISGTIDEKFALTADVESEFSDVNTSIGTINENIGYISGVVSGNYEYLNENFYNKTEINGISGLIVSGLREEIAGAFHFKGTVATSGELPDISEANVGDVYQVETLSSEFASNGEEWVELGSIVDLSNYYTSEQVNQEIEKATSGKLDQSTFNTFKTDEYDVFKADYETISGDFALSADIPLSTSQLANDAEFIDYPTFNDELSGIKEAIEELSALINA